MAPIRAYYLPADSTSAIDSSRPVSVEHLNALGWKISSVDGGHEEIVQAGQKLAQELGFPVTQEGYDTKNVATMAPEMMALLTKLVEAKDSDICLANGALVVVTGGDRYLDVEDVNTTGWIRIHLVAGILACIPAGAKHRLAFDERSREAGIMFFKETVSNIGLLVKEEIDNHPAHKAYLAQVIGHT